MRGRLRSEMEAEIRKIRRLLEQPQPEGARPVSDVSALIEEARKGTGGYSESELRWLAKKLADALEAAETRTTELERSIAELQPDPVLVEGSWFPVAELPKILGNFIRSNGQANRDAKAMYLRAERAETQLATIRDMVKSVRVAARENPLGWSNADASWTAFLDRVLDGVDRGQETT